MRHKSDYIYPGIAFGVIFLLILFVVVSGEKEYQSMTTELTTREIAGKVLLSEKRSRGTHLLEIDDKKSGSKLKYLLPKSWFFEKNKIVPDDSVCKALNSSSLVFYHLKNKVYVKCCSYEISR